jgi:hypothetical protein
MPPRLIRSPPTNGTRTLINDAAKADSVPAYYVWTTPPATPTLSVTRTATGLTLTFQGSLESADAVNGPWKDLPGASPMNVSAAGAAAFYRAKK